MNRIFACSLCAQASRPGLFSSLLLLEPILAPPLPKRYNKKLIEKTKARQTTFSSSGDVEKYLTGRTFFANWDVYALQKYIDGGFRTFRAGNGQICWQLKCAPQDEAGYFSSHAEGLYEQLSDIAPTPTIVIAGENSST